MNEKLFDDLKFGDTLHNVVRCKERNTVVGIHEFRVVGSSIKNKGSRVIENEFTGSLELVFADTIYRYENIIRDGLYIKGKEIVEE